MFENYENSIDLEKNNLFGIDIRYYRKVDFIYSKKIKKILTRTILKNVLMMVIILGFIISMDLLFINNVGATVLISALYIVMHWYYLAKNTRYIKEHDYQRCHKCHKVTIKLDQYNNSDCTRYFCINCMTYFNIYHHSIEMTNNY
jgi:hypothetical protein